MVGFGIRNNSHNTYTSNGISFQMVLFRCIVMCWVLKFNKFSKNVEKFLQEKINNNTYLFYVLTF